jgi:uncharacterized SAM-binding protein YcdF (DUF218 family)
VFVSVAVFVVAWPVLAWAAARVLMVRAELARADALVVLSGSANYVERTRWAARLFGEGRAPRVVLTNDTVPGPWSFTKERNPTFAELELEELTRAGVPADKILLLPRPVTSTHDEAEVVKEGAAERGWRSVLVVTSPFHSRRALRVMRRALGGSGIEVGLSTPPAGDQSPAPSRWWWHARGWHLVAGEYPKLIYYWLRY